MRVDAVAGGEEYVEWEKQKKGWTKWAGAYLSSAGGQVAASDQSRRQARARLSHQHHAVRDVPKSIARKALSSNSARFAGDSPAGNQLAGASAHGPTNIETPVGTVASTPPAFEMRRP